MLSLLCAAATLVPQGPGTSTAPVVINEFWYDDASTDNFEFVELYNRSGAPVDISLWKIVNRDPGSPSLGGTGGVDPTQVIPAGTILAPGAFYLLGNIALVPVAVPGFSQIIPGDSLENGPADTIELQDPTGLIIDSVVYEMGGQAPFGPFPSEGDGFYGDLAVGDTGSPSSSIGRWVDGFDTDDNGRDFSCTRVATPGTSNNLASALPYLELFDGGASGANVFTWSPGFVRARFIDPLSISPDNPTVKPASPQGGLAMATWDRTGGGNSVQFETAPLSDVVVESFVWIEPIMAPVNPAPYTPTLPPVILDTYNSGDGEWWALGVRGTVAANANPPDVGGYFAAIAPGVGTRYHFASGICWAHFRTPTFSRLYLLDLNNGQSPTVPGDYTVLAGPIDIVAGVNDGWQRLRLHVQGNSVQANFGGTFGCDDGLRAVATTNTPGPGAVYIAYREAVLYNSNGLAGCHPPLFDQFDVHAPTTSVTFIGAGSPTTLGVPAIGVDSLPVLGNLTWKITASGLAPIGAPNYSAAFLLLGFSTIPGGYPVSGTPPTVLGYIAPVAATLLGFPDGAGFLAFTLPLPCVPAYEGISLASQIVAVDPLLPYPLPIGTTRGMVTVVGR